MNGPESRLLIETARAVLDLMKVHNTGLGGPGVAGGVNTTRLEAAIQYYEHFETEAMKIAVAK
jgi:hypothetical protein